MAVTPLKAFLFSAGGVVAAAGAAYVSGALDPYFNPQPPAQVVAAMPPADAAPGPAEPTRPAEQARAPAPEVEAMKPAAPETDAMTPDAMKPAGPAGEATTPASPPAAAGPVAPTFDVVRVEGDGSLVVAGNAPPNARVDIINGAAVIGSTTAGPDGAFAIVLDDPLEPGDYQLALRATAADHAVLPSGQTALVSVPEKPDGQVLAMVEEPGKPAALMTVPEPVKQPGASPPAADEPVVPVEAAPVEAPPVEAAAKPEPAAPGAEAAAPVDEPASPVAAPAAAPRVVVEAVEIDGDKVFVAGLADPGRKVRAYANEIVLGDATTSPDGHFLVEATHPLAVGTYTVRVDALDVDGAKVVARATVPFEREPGEAMAAVAPVSPAATASATQQPVETASANPADDAGTQPAAVAAAEPADAVPETVSPKLEHVDGAVIIRRHDTLWHISRRVYGHGIRYTTIYLANQDQIRDPDLIWPGQVFRVPEKSKEGETANLDALGEQATTAPVEAQ